MERRSVKTSSVPRVSLLLLAVTEAGCASAGPSAPPDSLEPGVSFPSIPPPAPLPLGLEPQEESPPEVALCVTSGTVDVAGPMMHVDASGLRGVLPRARTPSATELDFVYGGPSAEAVPLANGEERRQLGLKLRAKDSCNLVYVMWRIEPALGVYVSVKHNPGAATHTECADHGYINLPASKLTVPAVAVGERHRLRTELDGRELRVFADGALVWKGELPSEAFAFDGPVGIRSDNVRFDFDLRADDDDASPSCDCPPPD